MVRDISSISIQLKVTSLKNSSNKIKDKKKVNIVEEK